MPRATGMWINSNASAPRAGDYTLAFTAETVFTFATAGERRACAGEMVAVLQRYGIPCTVREDNPSTAEGGS